MDFNPLFRDTSDISQEKIRIPTTDYGHPMKPFFIEIQNFWSWADKFWGIWGIFGQTISSESLVHVFHYSSIISTKTKPLYPHPKYLFGIGILIWAAKN
jgi:hypothetical protein